MAPFVRPFCSILWIGLHRIAIRFRSLFDLVLSSLQRRLTVRTNDPEEITVNPPASANSATTQTSTCAVFTITPQPQIDLEIVGVGAAGQVYRVDDDIVLKTCRVYEPPRDDASEREKWFYASETLFHFNLMRDERTVLRLLEHRPHPNIVEAIETNRPEGIYLRKYLQLSQLDPPTQPGRILWYQDIIRALLHIHDLGIAHSDVRMDNVLFDHRGRAVLCDFSASSPFGQPNPALPYPDLPVPINGLSEAVSDATDRFAVASLIFQMELGTKPELSVDSNQALVLPRVQTGLDRLDGMIKKAWLGQYNSTAHMLKDAESLPSDVSRDTSGRSPQPLSRESLQERIRHWRDQRESKFRCILQAFPTEDQLINLADSYGWGRDDDLRFRNYEAPYY